MGSMKPKIPSKKDQGLRVELTDGQLVISIGVKALKHAFEVSPDNYSPEHEDEQLAHVKDEDGFARDVLDQLLADVGDGSTVVQSMLDAAFLEVVDNGSLSLQEHELVDEDDDPTFP